MCSNSWNADRERKLSLSYGRDFIMEKGNKDLLYGCILYVFAFQYLHF